MSAQTDWELTLDVLRRVAGGDSSRRIAADLRRSHQCIEYHVTKLMRLMGTRSRTVVVGQAYARGVLAGWPAEVQLGPAYKLIKGEDDDRTQG